VLGARLPRVVLAAIVGAALASAGTVFQGLLRNPLADPFILGVSGGAATGAVAVILLGITIPGLVALAGFLGALGATALVYALARGRLRGGSERLLLVGVVVNAFLSSLILLLNHLAPPARRVAIFHWLTGNLGAFSLRPAEIALVAGLSLLGLMAFISRARDLDLLSTGDDAAVHLGVDLARVRATLFFAGSLVTGAAVSASGLVGFVGVIVPHALRLVLGPDHRLLVPASFLGGGAFLVLADAAARAIASPASPEELPVGVVTALSGGPFFLALLVGGRRGRAGLPSGGDS
jgi:iron complex transport system permease protein